MPTTRWTWLPRTRRTAVLLLLVCTSGLAALPQVDRPLPAVRFAPASGTFAASETVALSTETPAAIHYTVDGSLPTAASPVYDGPLTLATSTRLRAVAVETAADGASAAVPRLGPVATEIYLRVDPDTQRFTSHLPVVVIHTFDTGPLDGFGTEYVPAAMQVLEPVSGTTRMVGRAALDARIGIHVRGQSTRRFPKKQYAIEVRGDGDDKDSSRPLLGLPSGSDWVLYDSVFYDRSLIRNALAFAMSRRIGRYAPRTRFVEAYLVDDGGDLRAAHFLGVFTMIEKIARGRQRVDVGPDGLILRIDKGFADFYAAGRRLQFVHPKPEVMARAERRQQLDGVRSFIDDFGQAVQATGLTHPVTGQPYSSFIDVDAWIDHHIINTLAKNVDALRFSAYFHKDRDGRLVAGPLWDFDRSFGTPYDPRASEPEEWNAAWSDATDYFGEGWWWYLFRDPAFKARYRERFIALLNGEFSLENLERLVDATAAEVGEAAERNAHRWSQLPPKDGSHGAEVALLKEFLRRRVGWIKTQLAGDF